MRVVSDHRACQRCGSALHGGSPQKWCPGCRPIIRAEQKRRNRPHRGTGRCARCNKPRVPRATYCVACRAIVSAENRRRDRTPVAPYVHTPKPGTVRCPVCLGHYDVADVDDRPPCRYCGATT